MQKTGKKWLAAVLLAGALLQVPAFATEQRVEAPVVETAALPDGTQVRRTTETDGSVTTVKKMVDGTMMTTMDAANGCDSTTRVDADGTTVAAATLSREAIQSARGQAVRLMLPALSGTQSPRLTVALPDKTPVSVAIPVQEGTETVLLLQKDGSARSLKTAKDGDVLVASLADGDTVVLKD